VVVCWAPSRLMLIRSRLLFCKENLHVVSRGTFKMCSVVTFSAAYVYVTPGQSRQLCWPAQHVGAHTDRQRLLKGNGASITSVFWLCVWHPPCFLLPGRAESYWLATHDAVRRTQPALPVNIRFFIDCHLREQSSTPFHICKARALCGYIRTYCCLILEHTTA
jgi:hypothetical protein